MSDFTPFDYEQLGERIGIRRKPGEHIGAFKQRLQAHLDDTDSALLRARDEYATASTPPHREDVTITMPKDMWQALCDLADYGRSAYGFDKVDATLAGAEALKVVKTIVLGGVRG